MFNGSGLGKEGEHDGVTKRTHGHRMAGGRLRALAARLLSDPAVDSPPLVELWRALHGSDDGADAGLTFPSDAPVKRIDYAFFAADAAAPPNAAFRLQPRRIAVVGEPAVPWPASDHLSLRIELATVAAESSTRASS